MDMVATICKGPGLPVSNFQCETQCNLIGKVGDFTQSRSVGALGSLNFV